MNSNTTKNIDVKVIDESTVEAIKTACENVQADSDGNKFVYLHLDSTSGDVSTSISLIDSISKMDTEIIANCNGEIGLAGVILAAGSKFGKREATSTSMFRLIEEDRNIGKKRTSLSPNERNALEILGTLSGGKKRQIKALMLKGLKATAAEAKSLDLIDEVDGFKDRYAAQRSAAKKKSGDESKAQPN